MKDCTFCKIVNRDLPNYTLYEDDVVLVFLGIEPIHNGHTIIISKKHFKDISDIDLEVLNHINEIAKKMYDLLKQRLNFKGLKIVQNNGSYQDIKHYHMHLIPDFDDEKKLSLDEVYRILTK